MINDKERFKIEFNKCSDEELLNFFCETKIVLFRIERKELDMNLDFILTKYNVLKELILKRMKKVDSGEDDFLYDNDDINDHIIQKLKKNNVRFYNFYGGFAITDENVRITSTVSNITYKPPILITSADYDEGGYDEELEGKQCTRKCAMIEDDYNGSESLLAGEVYDLIINEVGNSFLHEPEKMVDFGVLSKEEFLESYSYLTEEDYEITKKEYEDLL